MVHTLSEPELPRILIGGGSALSRDDICSPVGPHRQHPSYSACIPEIDSRREIFSRPRQNCHGDLRHVRNLPEHLRELVVLLRGQSIQLLWLVESDKRDILP